MADRRLTYAEYLEIENAAETRSEFFGGQLWAVTGATRGRSEITGATYAHAVITSNLTGMLFSALRGSSCRVVAESSRVYFPELDEAAYPDLRVVCGGPEHHPDDLLAIVNPTVVIEVLSDSTEGFDRGEKFAKYRTLPSLRAYLLVNQAVQRLELVERGEGGTWSWRAAEAGQRLAIGVLGVEIEVDGVYEGVGESRVEGREG